MQRVVADERNTVKILELIGVVKQAVKALRAYRVFSKVIVGARQAAQHEVFVFCYLICRCKPYKKLHCAYKKPLALNRSENFDYITPGF